jgi:hypothetical protein
MVTRRRIWALWHLPGWAFFPSAPDVGTSVFSLSFALTFLTFATSRDLCTPQDPQTSALADFLIKGLRPQIGWQSNARQDTWDARGKCRQLFVVNGTYYGH